MDNIDYFFLLGSERSGTNFITKIFDNHPKVCGPSPTHIIRTFAQNMQNYGDLNKDGNWQILLSDISNFLKNQLGEWQTQVSYDELLKNINTRKLSSIVKFVYEKEAKFNVKQTIFIKENKVYNFLPFLLVSFPSTKYIYIVRDPRDNILSFKNSPNHPGGVIEGAKIWKNDQVEFLKIYFYLREINSIKIVKYEDLTSNTEATLKDMCMFLNVDYSSKMLDFHQNKLTKKNSKKLKNWENLGKPIISDNFNKYKTELSEIEIKYIEHTCKDEMNFFKYSFDYKEKNNLDKIIKQLKDTNEIKELLKYNTDEETIRTKRLDMIKTILSRKLEH